MINISTKSVLLEPSDTIVSVIEGDFQEPEIPVYGNLDGGLYIQKGVKGGAEVAEILERWVNGAIKAGIRLVPIISRNDNKLVHPLVDGIRLPTMQDFTEEILSDQREIYATWDPGKIEIYKEKIVLYDLLMEQLCRDSVKLSNYIKANATVDELKTFQNFVDSQRLDFYRLLRELNPDFPDISQFGGLENICYSIDIMKRFGIVEGEKAIRFLEGYQPIQDLKAQLMKTDKVMDTDPTLANSFIQGATLDEDGKLQFTGRVTLLRGDYTSAKEDLWQRLAVKTFSYASWVACHRLRAFQEELAKQYGRLDDGCLTKTGTIGFAITKYDWQFGRALWYLTRKGKFTDDENKLKFYIRCSDQQYKQVLSSFDYLYRYLKYSGNYSKKAADKFEISNNLLRIIYSTMRDYILHVKH